MLDKFKQVVAFVAQGDAVSNLTIGRGNVGEKSVYVAIVENRIASGAIGKAECDKLASLFKVIEAQQAPLVLYIDSAGARVSEGLPALGAFRRMFAAAVKASLSNAPMVAVLGTNCFGGASMLAALCGTRYFNESTRLAMSGPSILASAAGASALDDAFRAIADVSIGTNGRVKLEDAHFRMGDAIMLPQTMSAQQRHDQLVARIEAASKGASRPRGIAETVERKDLNLLYPMGYQLREHDGVLRGAASSPEGSVEVIGSIDKRPMTAARATALATEILALSATRPARLDILVECETHSASLEDEKLMLSSYLANFSRALAALRASGTMVRTIVLGKLGGGTYVALAAASSEVDVLYGGEIQLLPGKAIAAILGDNAPSSFSFADYLAAGVAERELKIGLV
jgi:hypothetical protein